MLDVWLGSWLGLLWPVFKKPTIHTAHRKLRENARYKDDTEMYTLIG